MTGRDLDLEVATSGWQDHANCLGCHPDLFFPERGASTREAKAVCAACVVRAECLDYALTHSEKFGIWGGLSERERRRIRKTRKPTGQTPEPPPAGPRCEVDGCDRAAVKGSTLCSGHRMRVYRHGDVRAHIPLLHHVHRQPAADGAA